MKRLGIEVPKEEVWFLHCGKCGVAKIELKMPKGLTRTAFLEKAKEKYPDWKILNPKTICPVCQGKESIVELIWKYEKPAHVFTFENDKFRAKGELKNNTKKVGRILILLTQTDDKIETSEYDCKTIDEGKEMAVRLLENMING